MLKNKTKLEIGVIMLVVFAVVGYMFFSGDSTYKVEAKRIALYDGNLYTLSSLYESSPITRSKDIKVFFEQKNGKILFGKGFQSESGDPWDFASSELYLANEDGTTEIKVSQKADVVYALFDRTGENIFYLVKKGHIRRDLYKYNVLTRKSTLLSEGASIPSLSPDGKKLLYLKVGKDFIEGGNYVGFAIFDLDIGNERIVPNTEKPYSEPVWTFDGRIFFSGEEIINIDGTGYIDLVTGDNYLNIPYVSGNHLWSKNGKFFLYESGLNVYLIEIDILNKRIVSAGAIAYGTSPQWVEEGKTISVLSPSAKAGDDALSIVDLNGKVLSGDKSQESKYYKNGKSLLRVKPTKVTQ